MIVRVVTELDAPAETVWALIKRKQTLLYVTRGLLGVSGAGRWPEAYREGQVVRGRLWFFHVVPGWLHEIRISSVDEKLRELRTQERGGFVRAWDHLLKVERLPEDRSRYTDEIRIEAGRLTPVVWAFASVFYRYRQARWRTLARVLA